MIIQGTTKTEVKERVLYTGLADMEVLAFNPGKEELMEILGTENIPDSMVQYSGVSDSGDATLRIDVWLSNREHGIVTKLSLYLEDSVRLSGKGKTQFINSIAQTTWAMEESDIQDAKWFKTVDVREAYVGEATLYEFLLAWTKENATGEDEAKFVLENTISSMINSEDVSELNDLLQIYGNDKVRVLLVVKEGKYQNVYTGAFLKENSNYTKGLVKQIDNYFPSAATYQNSLKLRVFDPLADRPSTSVEGATDEETINSMQEYI